MRTHNSRVLIVMGVLLVLGIPACETGMPAGAGVPQSSRVVPIGSSTISPAKPGEVSSYTYVQTGIGPNNFRAEGTLTAQIAPYEHPTLGTGFTESSSIVADRFDGFTKLDSIVITSSSSYVKDGPDAPTKLVALNINGDSRIISEPTDGAIAPLRDGDLYVGLSYTYIYEAGSFVTIDYSATGTVVSIEQVVVPFGTIGTYKIIESYNIDQFPNPSSGMNTIWVHPKLGLVRSESDFTVERSFQEGGTSTEHTVVELVSTNIPLGDG